MRVVVGRRWNNPEIYTEITNDGIRMSISLRDFVLALASEVGSPAMIMTKSSLLEKLHAATDKVLAEVKTASKEVV